MGAIDATGVCQWRLGDLRLVVQGGGLTSETEQDTFGTFQHPGFPLPKYQACGTFLFLSRGILYPNCWDPESETCKT